MKMKFISAALFSLFLAIAVIVPVLAQQQSAPTSTPAKPVKINFNKPIPTVDPACMQTAIKKRDGAIIAAIDAYTTAIKSELQNRQDTSAAAWSIAERKERRVALYKIWRDYRVAMEKSRKDLRIAKDSAWKQFYADRKACGTVGASDDPGNAGADAQL